MIAARRAMLVGAALHEAETKRGERLGQQLLLVGVELPLGLLLLSLDIAMLRRPTARAIVSGERHWRRFRRNRRAN